MTLSLNTQYIGPVPAGTRLTASARRSGGGRRIFFSTCEVRDQDGRLVATGSVTYRYRGDAWTRRAARPRGSRPGTSVPLRSDGVAHSNCRFPR